MVVDGNGSSTCVAASWFNCVSLAAAAGESEGAAAAWSGRLELGIGGGSGSEVAAAGFSGGAGLEFDGCESEANFCFLAPLSSAGDVIGRVLLLVETFADKCCEFAAENIGLHSSDAVLRFSTSSQSVT